MRHMGTIENWKMVEMRHENVRNTSSGPSGLRRVQGPSKREDRVPSRGKQGKENGAQAHSAAPIRRVNGNHWRTRYDPVWNCPVQDRALKHSWLFLIGCLVFAFAAIGITVFT